MEKRDQRRYPLSLYTCLRADGGHESAATTRDISCGGAYLQLDAPLAVGTRTALTVCFRGSQQPGDVPSDICGVELTGTVLRSEPTGMAVRFDRELEFIESHIAANQYM